MNYSSGDKLFLAFHIFSSNFVNEKCIEQAPSISSPVLNPSMNTFSLIRENLCAQLTQFPLSFPGSFVATCCSVRRKNSAGTQVTGPGWAPATQPCREVVVVVVFPVPCGDMKPLFKFSWSPCSIGAVIPSCSLQCSYNLVSS